MRVLRKLKEAARRFIEREQPVILMYHRVARVTHDPWQLAVSPDRFAEQIEALVQLRRVVPLRWLAAALAQGKVPKKVAAVTFDDGYADLLTEANPILNRYTCPATVFVVTGAVGNTCAFWWDELSRIVLETPSLPDELETKIGGRVQRWRIVDQPAGGRQQEIAGGLAVSRRRLHDALWRLLRPLEPEPRSEHLMQLCIWAGSGIERSSAHRPLDMPELRRLSVPGFIDIGAHSVNHPALSGLDETARRAEVEGSRAGCEELIGEPIHSFAYPFGDFDDATVACVREAGFACACTTRSGRVSTQSDIMRLPRLAVGNWSGPAFARWLAPNLI